VIRGLTITGMLVASTALANPRADPFGGPDQGIPGRITIRAPEPVVTWFEGCGYATNAADPGNLARWENPPLDAPAHECAPPPPSPPGGSNWASPDIAHLRFQDEWLYIDVRPPLVHIKGVYGFEYSGSGPFSMTFPLPSCSSPIMDSLSCLDLEGRRLLLERGELSGGWRWTIPAEGPGRYVIEIRYRQTLTDGVIHYVLSSSQSWPEPIGRVQVIITTPHDGWLHSSYRLHPWATKGVCTYVIDAVNFRTDRDLVLTWEALSGESGSLDGGVTDERGKPVGFATLELLGQGKGAISRESGLFRISGVEPGTYTVQVSGIGHSRAVDNVVVLPGAATEIDVVLNSIPTR